jgi:hypothetical protein
MLGLERGTSLSGPEASAGCWARTRAEFLWRAWGEGGVLLLLTILLALLLAILLTPISGWVGGFKRPEKLIEGVAGGVEGCWWAA